MGCSNDLLKPLCRWREDNNIIYLSVESVGISGAQWIERLEEKGFRVGEYAKYVLCSKDFWSTKNVLFEVAILKGNSFKDEDRFTKKIRAKARCHQLTKPSPEIACLLREVLTDDDIKAMGFWWIVIMHDPIKDNEGDPSFLNIYRHAEGRWLGAYCVRPVHSWHPYRGFAFVLSQTNIENNNGKNQKNIVI